MAEQSLRAVPDSWWRHACEIVEHPICCCDLSDKFIWVNHAWEKLTGYSRIELCGRKPGTGKRWQDITHPDDVGHDQLDVEAMVAGDVVHYQKAKRFIHRDGHDVPVLIHVNRFPRNLDNFTCFIGEAVTQDCCDEDVDRLQAEFDRTQQRVEATLSALAQRLIKIEGEPRSVSETEEHNRTTITIGNNSTTWIVTIVLAILSAVGYLIYIGGWNQHGGDALPPHLHQQEEPK